MQPFQHLDLLLSRFSSLGCTRVHFKLLAENDNSKQQIYLGGSFEVLQLLPFGPIRTAAIGQRPNFKAPLRMFWIDASGAIDQAKGAQLILYPDYPEVRLSGFLAGCRIAPSQFLRPLQRQQRSHNNGPDGRILFFGVAPTSDVFVYLALPGSPIEQQVRARIDRRLARQSGVLWQFASSDTPAARASLVARLADIRRTGWHNGTRLDATGAAMNYTAQNGGGYTLEALFGIKPNGRSEPDFEGWELKAYSRDRITLMTPEPDGGYYATHGVESFVRRYGRMLNGDRMYFTGLHRYGRQCEATGMTLTLSGFDVRLGKMTGVEGGIELHDRSGALSAKWTFPRLIEHWGRKHGSAAYVPYEARSAPGRSYRYLSPVLLGEGTDFNRYLGQIASGTVVYDPGCKIESVSSRPKSKARSQFRISVSRLGALYERFEAVPY